MLGEVVLEYKYPPKAAPRMHATIVVMPIQPLAVVIREVGTISGIIPYFEGLKKVV
jgi:hypothetical protein